METPFLANRPEPDEAQASRSTLSSTLSLQCISCDKLLIWRGGGSNRFAWKAFCSVCLVLELGFYIYVVTIERPFLIVFALFSLVKFLIETWGQDTPTWICPGGIGMFFVIYCLILPGIIYYDGVCTQNPDMDALFPTPLVRSLVGTLLFFGGSGFSLFYEVSRFKWKKDPANKGKLHQIGLASYCIHPNYLGDLFTYTGWGIAAGTSCALSAPVYMIWSFGVFVCPNSDAYLAQRYASEWDVYSQKTATLIPGFRSTSLRLPLKHPQRHPWHLKSGPRLPPRMLSL
ncbi:unnamed protein product [Amoebophrya sp. A25]|nr:unnamed protein product [Amoebophrya sp. A25]|eukprot:GSA25T00022271001.1